MNYDYLLFVEISILPHVLQHGGGPQQLMHTDSTLMLLVGGGVTLPWILINI